MIYIFMKNFGGYILNLKTGETKVELEDWKPVLHIKENEDENIVCQLGLNISHQKSDAYFNQLIGKDYYFDLDLAKKVFKTAYFIGLNDPYVSKFLFDGRNKIKIATSNDSLIGLLDVENRKHKEFFLENIILKDKFLEKNYSRDKESKCLNYEIKTDFIKLISKEPFLYQMFLSMNYCSFSDNKEQLETLHGKVLEKINKILLGRREVKIFDKLFKESCESGFFSDLEANLSGYDISPFLKAKEEYKKQIPENVRGMIGLKEINDIYSNFVDNPFEWEREDLSFNDFIVKKMSTRLYNRASRDYADNILSFELIEPYSDYEMRKDIINLS